MFGVELLILSCFTVIVLTKFRITYVIPPHLQACRKFRQMKEVCTLEICIRSEKTRQILVVHSDV